MSYKEVFNSLKEVFPQVDIRILKAVAIEHINDVDAAVEFIISEVLPVLGTPQGPVHGVNKSGESGEMPDKSTDVESIRNSSMEGDAGFFMDQRPLKCDISENVSSAEHVVTQNELTASISDQGAVEQKGPGNYLLVKTMPPLDGESSGCASETEGNISYVQASSFKEEPFSGSFHSGLVENIRAIDTLVSEENEVHQLGFFSKSLDSSIDIDKDFGGSSLMLASESLLSSEHLVASNESSKPDHQYIESLVPSETSMTSDKSSHPDHQFDKADTLLNFEVEPLNIDTVNIDNSSPLTVATRSGQIVKTDLLEDFVNDAKNFKKTLVSTLESVLGLAKVVEDQEREADQAKDKASGAGLDIIAKAEDLKEMLMHAKEANYMHAGEVYGERSILATEVKELQSRLLSLADEKDKSLSVIEEMRKTLEARLVVAETEKARAELEKRNKEENALRELHIQEVMMEQIVEESKILKQEAEENSKLREFLVDRGRLVDILQGEISVICEDVRALKKRVDKRLPCGGLTSSGRLSLSSSFSRSDNRENPSSRTVEPVVSPVGDHVPVLGISEPQNPEVSERGSIAAESVSRADDHKAASEDDWDMFEDADLPRPAMNA